MRRYITPPLPVSRRSKVEAVKHLIYGHLRDRAGPHTLDSLEQVANDILAALNLEAA